MLLNKNTFSFGETMKIDDISLWQAFQAVAQQESFSKASLRLNLTVPQVSKRIIKLEEQLGVRLFQRSTRLVSLTNEGKALLPRVNSLVEDWKNVESLFDHKKQELEGVIKVTSIPFIAQRFLLPVFSEFLKKHRKVKIELDLSENLVNLLESNTDMAIRIHHDPPDSSLIYRKLIPNTMVACASPKYLKNHPVEIKKPKDLHQHEILALAIHNKCRFENSSLTVDDLKKSKRIYCNNGHFLTELGLNHFGVLIRSRWDVQEHLRNGELIEILKDYPVSNFGNIYAVLPSKKLLAPRISALLEVISLEFSK